MHLGTLPLKGLKGYMGSLYKYIQVHSAQVHSAQVCQYNMLFFIQANICQMIFLQVMNQAGIVMT
jgi:hypothetical protein